jgi:type II secretion system protein G
MINKLMKGFKKNNKGFTLVELMVVVVIIGILVAIAIPVYNASTARAEAGACEANIRMIESAIEQYKMNNDGTVPSWTDLTTGEKQYFKSEQKCPTDDAEAKKYTINSEGVVTCPNGHTD